MASRFPSARNVHVCSRIALDSHFNENMTKLQNINILMNAQQHRGARRTSATESQMKHLYYALNIFMWHALDLRNMHPIGKKIVSSDSTVGTVLVQYCFGYTILNA